MDSQNITHTELVSALLKPGEKIMEYINPERCNAFHLCLGLAGEVAEIMETYSSWEYCKHEMNKENLIEEFGDLMFYMEGVRQFLFMEKDKLESKIRDMGNCEDCQCSIGFNFTSLIIDSGSIIDVIKKWAVYNEPIHITNLVKIETGLASLYYRIDCILHQIGINKNEIIENNITKLKKRYPKMSYSDNDAQKRADK